MDTHKTSAWGHKATDQAHVFATRILTMEWPSENAEQALFITRHLSQSKSGPGLPDSYGDSGIHLPVPENRPAGFRHAFSRLHPRPHLRGIEKPQALHLVVPKSGGVS